MRLEEHVMAKIIYNQMCEFSNLKGWREVAKQTLTIFIYMIPGAGIPMLREK